MNSVVPIKAIPRGPSGSSLASRALAKILQLRNRVKISKLGKYSPARVECLESYCHRTPPLRVLLVCVLMPWPALIVELVGEWIPLQDPSSGWKANYGAYIRIFIAISFGAGAALFQVRATTSSKKMLIISVSCGSCAVAVTILVARLWVFPVPLSFFVFGPCVTFTFVVLFLTLLRQTNAVTTTEAGDGTLNYKMLLVGTQVLLATVYLSFNILFAKSSPELRLILVFFLPVLKISLKHLIARLASKIPESIPTVVVFTVDVFNGLYTSICMQSSGSWWTSILMIFINIVYTVLSALDINRTAKKFQDLNNKSVSIAQRHAWRPETAHSGSRSRSSILIASAKSQTKTNLVEQEISFFKNAKSFGASQGSIVAQKAQLSACLLFQMEYRSLVGYIEAVMPLVYAVYLMILVHLPSAEYYPHSRSLTSEQLKTTIASISVYSATEIVSLVWLHIMVKRKLGFSLFYQLSFVLETEMIQLQARLFLWIIILLQITLTHFGMDFTFAFEWLHRS